MEQCLRMFILHFLNKEFSVDIGSAKLLAVLYKLFFNEVCLKTELGFGLFVMLCRNV